MPTSISKPKEEPIVLKSRTITLRDGPTIYSVTDFPHDEKATAAGFDVTKSEPGKPREVIYCYPFLSSRPTTELKVDSGTVQISFK